MKKIIFILSLIIAIFVFYLYVDYKSIKANNAFIVKDTAGIILIESSVEDGKIVYDVTYANRLLLLFKPKISEIYSYKFSKIHLYEVNILNITLKMNDGTSIEKNYYFK